MTSFQYNLFDCNLIEPSGNTTNLQVLIIYNSDGLIALKVASTTEYIENQFDYLDKLSLSYQLVKKQNSDFAQQIKAYLAGKNQSEQKFEINWQLIQGTDFQKKVWRKIEGIPFGISISYKQIANLLNTKAYRAVGGACGANPVMIAIPCHRVLAVSNRLGGFSSGIELKQKLLNLESIKYKTN